MNIKYSVKLVKEICSYLHTGMPISEVCNLKDMPSRSTFYQWQNKRSEFREAIKDARIFGCHALADDILSIADDSSEDYIDTIDNEGNSVRVVNKAAIMRARLRIDVRKWILAKMLPKIYGDKIQLDHKGSESLAEMLKAGRLRVQANRDKQRSQD